MPTPALNAVNFQWSGVAGGAASTPLSSVAFSWANTSATVLFPVGFRSGAIGRPTKTPDPQPVVVSAKGFKSGSIGEPEAIYASQVASLWVRQREWEPSTKFGVPTVLESGSDAFAVNGFRSTAFGVPQRVAVALPASVQSGAIGQATMASWYAVQSLPPGSAIGQPTRVHVTRHIPSGPSTRFGQPVIAREGHC